MWSVHTMLHLVSESRSCIPKTLFAAIRNKVSDFLFQAFSLSMDLSHHISPSWLCCRSPCSRGTSPTAESTSLPAFSLPRPRDGPQDQTEGLSQTFLPRPALDKLFVWFFFKVIPHDLILLQMYAEQRPSSDMSARSSDSELSDVSALSRASSASRLSSTSYMSIQSERPGGRLRSVCCGCDASRLKC